MVTLNMTSFRPPLSENPICIWSPFGHSVHLGEFNLSLGPLEITIAIQTLKRPFGNQIWENHFKYKSLRVMHGCITLIALHDNAECSCNLISLSTSHSLLDTENENR